MYGLIISFGIFLAVLWAEKLLKADKLSPNSAELKEFWRLCLGTVVFGIIGARIYHVVDFWEVYLVDVGRIFEVWRGGLGIIGGIIGGGLFLLVYTQKFALRTKYLLDIAALSIPLAQSVGRWGNFFNNELYGKATTLPWGFEVENSGEKYHPVFLYESLAMLLTFGILNTLAKNKYLKIGSGRPTLTYLFIYSFVRFFLEFLKPNPWKIYDVNVAQTLCLVAIVACRLTLSATKQDN